MSQHLAGASAPYAFSTLVSDFIRHAQYELGFSRESVSKYGECLDKVQASCLDKPVTEFSKDDLFHLRKGLVERNLSLSRQLSILLSLRRFLRYLAEDRDLPVLDYKSIRIPKRPRKEVTFLTAEEVQRFVSAIPRYTYRGEPHSRGLRFRALVEVLLGSAMRIGEVLSLDLTDVDFKNTEAKVVGKGRKERTVFFTKRSIYWLKEYLAARTDSHPALFVTHDGRGRLKRPDIWRTFKQYRESAGIAKRVTPHLLRHTAATTLLFRGCPVGHIKEILGHERLETTCRYYLGLDHRAAKIAHSEFLQYS